MISSSALGQTVVSFVHKKSQVSKIYIFCGNKARHEKWAKEWPKVEGVYTDIIPICELLKQAIQDCDHNSVSISFIKANDGVSKENLDTLDSSFMYTQILKEILLTIDFEQNHINDFLTYCREQLTGNTISNLKMSIRSRRNIVITSQFGGIHINDSFIPCSIEHYV